MKAHLITLIAITFCCSAQAKIGETYRQTTARYGQPVESIIGRKGYIYRSHAMRIVVTFVGGVSEAESYAPLDPDHKFTARETRHILRSQTNGQVGFAKYQNQSTDFLFDSFYSDDGKLFAAVVKSGRMVGVSTRKWREARF